MNFERLFLLRQSNGLTQKEMGEILGVKRVAVSQWENTKEIIPLDKLNIYSNYFLVSLDYIVGLDDNKRKIKKIKLNKKAINDTTIIFLCFFNFLLVLPRLLIFLTPLLYYCLKKVILFYCITLC